jgi:hypothetical protein
MLNLTYTARDQIGSETRYTDLTGSNKIGYSTMTYDSEGRLTNLQHQNGSGSNLANYTYGYDIGDRVTSETRNGAPPRPTSTTQRIN